MKYRNAQKSSGAARKVIYHTRGVQKNARPTETELGAMPQSTVLRRRKSNKNFDVADRKVSSLAA